MITKEKNVIKLFVSIIIFFVLLNCGQVFAVEYVTDKSLAFEQWESLPEEERKNNIQPTYNDLQIVDSMKRSSYNALVGAGDLNLESRYSLLDNQTITVKNQKQTALCWAFSFSSILETNVEKKYGIDLEYSPICMDYVSSNLYGKKIGADGNFHMVLSNAIAGKGLTYESEMPFEDYYNESTNPQETYYLSYDNVDQEDLKSNVKIIKTVNFANIYKSLQGNQIAYKNSASFFGALTYTEEQILAVREKIKNHIKNYGAVFSFTRAGWDLSNSLDFNPETNAYYSDIAIGVDHAITIIGWDDNYSKTNFKEGSQPLHDGAYIVLNSWGEGFGDNGFYYISYDDAYIEQEVSGIVNMQDFSRDSDKGYDNIYQYDDLGFSYSSMFLNENYTEILGEGYLANVFTKQNQEKREAISEIGIFVPITEGIEVYIDNNGDMQNYEKVASYTGVNALEPGYHTLKLSSPVEIAGTKFSVSIKYINAEGASYALECNLKDSGLSSQDVVFSNAKANKGESYISIDGNNWTDIDGYNVPKTATELTAYKNTNACIKAFTTVLEGIPVISVDAISLNKSELELEEEETGIIVATITPSNATNQNVVWSSSNEEVATVSGGVVTGIGEGDAVITATTEDGGKTAECEVTVNAKTVAVEGVSLNKSELEIEEEETGIIVATITPSNATNKNIVWSSSNEEVATVSGGVVTGIGEGEAVITATTEDGEMAAECEIVVNEKEVPTIAVQGVSLNKSELEIEEEETETLAATITPSNATNKNVVWSSSNEEVATVNGGVVTAKKAGEVTITVTTQDGERAAECEINVTAKIVAVQGVSLNKEELEIQKGSTGVLSATITPSNATNKNIVWSSSNEEVATVSGGVVTAKKVGEAVITATTEDGAKAAECEIIVKETSSILLKNLILNKIKETIEVGDTINLVVTLDPIDATNQNVKWSSSNEAVATISQKGIITAIKEGTTTIKVMSEDEKFEASCTLTVTKKKNNDDDIYKEENVIKNIDNTTTDKKIPDTGIIFIKGIIGVIFVFVIVKFVRYKFLKIKEK